MNGYAMGDRYTAVATYTGTATSTYVKGYTVTAEYTGTVSRIALNRVRYVAIFEGMAIFSDIPDPNDTSDLMSRRPIRPTRLRLSTPKHQSFQIHLANQRIPSRKHLTQIHRRSRRPPCFRSTGLTFWCRCW